MNEPEVSRRQSYALLNDLRFHYLTWQPPEPGPGVVLLHGLASNARIWDKVGPLLAGAGCEVYAPDQRGHGLTDKPAQDYGFAPVTGDLTAGIDYWHLRQPVLVGHSWGAAVALEYATRHPFGPLAPAAVVLVDGGLTALQDGPEDDWESVRERLKPPALAGMPVEQFVARLQRVTAIGRRMSPSRSSCPISTSPKTRPLPRISTSIITWQFCALWEYQPQAVLRKVACPVLAILAQPAGGEQNEFWRRKQQAVPKARETRPDLQVLWMQDSIHDLPLQRPAELAQAILEFTAP